MNAPVAPSRARRARRPSPTEQWLMEHENTVEDRVEHGVGSDGESQKFEHRTATLERLYFATSWGWESRAIPSTNTRMCIDAGARIDCGDCGDDCSPDPMNPQYNNCAGRDKFATMQCPGLNCGKLVYDFGARSVNAELLVSPNQSRAADAEGTMLEPSFAGTSPKVRLEAALAAHMKRYHPDEAESRGLGREAPSDRR